GRDDIAGIAPCAVAEGGDAERLDAVVSLLARLHRLSAWLREPHPAEEWRRRLAGEFTALLPAMARDDGEQQARRIVLEALDGFAAQAAGTGPLPLDVVRAALDEALQAPSPHQPFLGGGVTFAGIVPLRTVPFRAICLLGMDAEAFPRREPPGDVNRLASGSVRGGRRLGDRSVREDDRFLFLQLLSAAGDAFHVSYGGRDARDGSVREPSALVSELLDVAQRYLPPGQDARQRLVLSHPLQPFSPQAFGAPMPGEQASDAAPRRFSYRAQWWQPVRGGGALQPATPFSAAALAARDDDEADALTLQELQSFLRNPARGFLRGRLDMALPYRDDARGEDREPQGDNALLRHQVVTALIECEHDDAALRARGLLPPGHEGIGFAADARTRAALLREAVADWRGDAPAT